MGLIKSGKGILFVWGDMDENFCQCCLHLAGKNVYTIEQ